MSALACQGVKGLARSGVLGRAWLCHRLKGRQGRHHQRQEQGVCVYEEHNLCECYGG